MKVGGIWRINYFIELKRDFLRDLKINGQFGVG